MDHRQRRDQHFWSCITLLIGIFVGVIVTLIMLRLGLEWGCQIGNHTECKIQNKAIVTKVSLMGDHRADIKLYFEMHGIERKHEMYINWYDPNQNGIDERIVEFFRNASEEAMNKYHQETYAIQAKEEAKIREREEREEYERLKKKFDCNMVNIKTI